MSIQFYLNSTVVKSMTWDFIYLFFINSGPVCKKFELELTCSDKIQSGRLKNCLCHSPRFGSKKRKSDWLCDILLKAQCTMTIFFTFLDITFCLFDEFAQIQTAWFPWRSVNLKCKFSFEPKTARKYFCIFAVASKMGQIKK